MIKKVKEFVQKKKQEKVQKKQLEEAKKYYELIQYGGLFIQFIQKDLEKMAKKNFNRKQRRRFEKSLNKKGKLTPEIVQYYQTKVDEIIMNISKRLEEKK